MEYTPWAWGVRKTCRIFIFVYFYITGACEHHLTFTHTHTQKHTFHYLAFYLFSLENYTK